MERKLCLVTGADSGIGKGLALSLANAGHHVVACSRTGQLGKQAQREIIAKTGSRYVDFLVADLASFESVQQAAELFKQRYNSLDVLANIAGATFFQREETEDGIEKGLQVNVLGPFYLTQLLLDSLKASKNGRIVNVVGEFHRKVSLELDDLQWEKRKYNAMKVGSTAMLHRIMLTYEWARELEGTGVTANCFHPGAVRTQMIHSFPWYFKLLVGWMQLFYQSPQKGADTGFWLATEPKIKEVTGKYWIKRQFRSSSEESRDEEQARKLWEAVCNLLPD